MKLLVTGGAGFIGANFILYWMKNHQEDQIVNLDLLTYAGNLENLHSIEKNPQYLFIRGDICDVETVVKAMRGIDIVVHFAAESHVDRSIMNPSTFVKTNVLGTQVLLQSALNNKVKRFHHVSCYDEKTRAYTKKGLKYYWELQDSDEVLSLQTNTHEIQWKKIEKVIVQDYEGEMININSNRITMKITPNHRMLLETPKAKKIIFKEAQKLGAINIIPHGIWQSKTKIDRNFMYLLGFFIGDGFLAYQEKKIPNKTGLTKYEYIVQARSLQTGQFSVIESTGMQQFTICHSYRIFLDVPLKDKGRNRLEQVLSKLHIKWHAHKGKAGEHIYFSSQAISDIFQDCRQGALYKQIPEWALEVDNEGLQALFDGLIDADGSWGQYPRLYTSSWRLAETFSELCIKLGFIPRIFERKSKGNYYKGRLIKGKNSYIITATMAQRKIRVGKSLNQTSKSYYEGKIWCVKVPDNKNLLVERNGTFAFCGNTDEVFGELALDAKVKFTEQTPYNPRSPYAASKAGSDHLVRAYNTTYGLPITITNCSNNFGPFMFPEKLIPLAITNVIEGKKIPIYGDGLYTRDWLYVEDHARAIDMVLQKGNVGETYVVGGMTELISNIEVAKKIVKLLGQDESFIEFVKDRPGHDRKYDVDWSKIHQLGWRPLHDFDEWLAKTVEWYRENQNWWHSVKNGAYKEYYQKQYGKST